MGEAQNNPMAQWMAERTKASTVINAAITAATEQGISAAALFTMMTEHGIKALLKLEVMTAVQQGQKVDFERPEKFVTQMLMAYRAELLAQIAGGADSADRPSS
jgi:hypothetical protein